MPAPSPTTKPSRSLSKGRQACSGSSLRVERACIAANPPTPIGVMAASEPPAIITSASPRSMMRYASPMECALVVQAVAVASIGPLGAVPDAHMPGRQVHDGRRNKERGNLARAAVQHVAVLALDDVEPADAGADVNADALGVFRRDLQPGCARIASSVAAMAKWIKRAILRASFLSMNCSGSKFFTSAAKVTGKAGGIEAG